MKKYLICSLLSALVLSGCAAPNLNTENLSNVATTNALNSQITKLGKLSLDLPKDLSIKNPSIVPKVAMEKLLTESRKPLGSTVNQKSSQIHIDMLKTALDMMNQVDNYTDAVKIGRKAALTVYKDLVANNDVHYDMINIISESLIFARVQDQLPNNYDNNSLVNEYRTFIYAFTWLTKNTTKAVTGHPKNLSIFAYNVMIDIKKDPKMSDAIKNRDAYYVGSFALLLYSKKPEYSEYRKVAQDALNTCNNVSSAQELYNIVHKVLDVISDH